MTTEAALGARDFEILVVVVNYRTPDLVCRCIESLAAETKLLKGLRVAIVDNASGDGSVEKLQSFIKEKGWNAWAWVIASPYNGGFASGNNLAIREALASERPPDFIWLLNPDSSIFPGAGRALVEFATNRPKVGIMGSLLHDENGPWRIAFRFPSLLGEIEKGLSLGLISRALKHRRAPREMSDTPTQVDWVAGASMLIRREVFDAIGMMDEGYFLYFEETDFCLRARRADWECWYVPESQVLHLRGQSTGVTKIGSRRRLPTYWFESRRRYFVKSRGLLYAIATDVAWIAALSIKRARYALQGKPNTDPEWFLLDSIVESSLVKGWGTYRSCRTAEHLENA